MTRKKYIKGFHTQTLLKQGVIRIGNEFVQEWKDSKLAPDNQTEFMRQKNCQPQAPANEEKCRITWTRVLRALRLHLWIAELQRRIWEVPQGVAQAHLTWDVGMSTQSQTRFMNQMDGMTRFLRDFGTHHR